MAETNQRNGSPGGTDRERKAKPAHDPTVAPGYNDRKFGEKATEEDIRKGNITKVTRVYLDENDPS